MSKKKFGIVHEDILSDMDVSLQAKGLYAILCLYADKSGMCYPSIRTLCEKASVTPRTIHRLLNELKEKKHVNREGKKFYLNKGLS
jgi:DNA-binding IclR family transcriptional regulator